MISEFVRKSNRPKFEELKKNTNELFAFIIRIKQLKKREKWKHPIFNHSFELLTWVICQVGIFKLQFNVLLSSWMVRYIYVYMNMFKRAIFHFTNVGPSSSIWSMGPLILKLIYLFFSFNATDCWNFLLFLLVLKDIQYCTLRLHSQYKMRSTWIPIRFAIRITNSTKKNTSNQNHHHLNPKIYLFNNALFESDWNCGGCTHYLHKWNGFQWRTLFVGYVRLVARILIELNVILSPFVVNFVLNQTKTH